MIQKPWGHETILETNPDYTVKQIYVKPKHKLSKQFHNEKTETMFLVAGVGFLQIGDDLFKMAKMFPYYIRPNTIHRLWAGDDAPCVVVEVSTSELSDVVRLEDDYDRK